MNRQQAIALSAALAGQSLGHSVVLAYDAAGAESVTVALDPAPIYTGPQLAALTTYCAGHALTLSIGVAAMSVT